ncbi:MAG: histidine kinase dimerization/phospho-acceptor domain-containing protein [Pyrinomonadaceae bacterium]
MTEQESKGANSDSEQQLRARIADYEAKLNEDKELLTSFRHEINNPLTGILGQAQLLLREELSDKARKRAKTIEQLAMRLRDIVAELRQVQRPISKAKEPTLKAEGR